MNINNNKIGFLFDLDGVLIDSENQYSNIWRQINLEYPTGVENLENVIKGTTLTQILDTYYPAENEKAAVSKRLHELESKMRYNYLPFAKEFLEELKSRNLPCVLVTSSDDKKMEHLREEQPDLENYFDFIVTGNIVTSSKPSPEGYLLGAEKIGCQPQNCVVFEDSLQGVMAGHNANAFVVGMIGTLTTDILAPYSHIQVNNFNEIDLDNLIHILESR